MLFGDLSTGRGTFFAGGEFGARHCPQRPIGRTCATAPRRGPLAKLLWADLLEKGVKLNPSYKLSGSCHVIIQVSCTRFICSPLILFDRSVTELLCIVFEFVMS